MAPAVIESLQDQATILRSVANELDDIAHTKEGRELTKELVSVVRNIRVLARFLDVAIRFTEMRQEHERLVTKVKAAAANQ